MATDLEKAYKALSGKAAVYKRLFDYYDGEQPLLYTNKRLEEIFRGMDAVFVENWCAVVIDSVRDRINLRGIRVGAGAQSRWEELWDESQLKLESDDVHEAVLVAGESFIVAWPDEGGEPQAYFNDPRLCHVFYDPENPRIKRFAAKWWVTEEETARLTLYYPDRLEYYGTKNKFNGVSSARAFLPLEEPQAENPYGQIPVFHFRLGRRSGGAIKSDLKNVIPVQNGINKLLTDMMVAAEYGAFKQRYIISNADVGGKLKNAPNEIWDLPAGDGMSQQTQAGQFDATPLDNYLKAIENLSTAVSSITRTPKHYFFSVGSNLSGESLTAMEAPLNKKAQDRIDRFIPEWKEVARFMMLVARVEVGIRDIAIEFDAPEMVQPRTEAETREINVRAGMPLVTACRESGWNQEQIDKMLKDKEEEAKRNKSTLAQSLLEAQRRFDQGGNSVNSKQSTVNSNQGNGNQALGAKAPG